MKILLILIGKTDEKYLKDGLGIYIKRLKHYCKLEILELKEAKTSKRPSELMAKEAEAITEKLKPGDHLILLDEKGKQISSVDFANMIEKLSIHAAKRIVFVIGGAYGLAETLKKRADKIISFSALTFSHQMIRLFFLEQLYRAFTIIKNEKYHNP